MTAQRHFVIAGGGLAGAKAAETLRQEGFDGAVTIVCAESERPYERPPLSKDFLAGTKSRESVFVHEERWYVDNDVRLRLGRRATRLHPARHELGLENGEVLGFDKLLLATGSSPNRINLPGTDLEGIRYLRQIGDSEVLNRELHEGGRHIVLVGGGWIGLEVASAARGFGNEVTVLEPQRTVLNAALGDELGAMFGELHRDHGVQILRTGLAEVRGRRGRVDAVLTESGDELRADVVVVGVGARPNVELPLDAHLDTDNGVLTDATMQTSHPDVYAAGDIANSLHPLFGQRLRVEHWANALKGGPVAARSMLGQRATYDAVPYFFSDQYDLGMEYSGYVGPERYDRVVYRGDRQSREFIAFWLREGKVQAGMNVNVWDVTDDIQALVRSGHQVDPDRLADVDVPLSDLVGAPAGS